MISGQPFTVVHFSVRSSLPARRGKLELPNKLN